MTIWVNLSTAWDLHGPPTGIARVEQRIAQALRQSLGPARVRYCRFDRKRAAFVECPAEPPRGRSRVPDRQRVLGEPVIGKREALATVVRGLGDLMPGRLRLPARRLAAFLYPTGRGGAVAGPGAGDAWGARTAFAYPAAGGASSRAEHGARPRRRAGAGRAGRGLGPQCLGPGDVLVTLGLEWETGCMVMLSEIKQGLGIRILGCCHDLVPIKYPHYCPRYVADLFPAYLEELALACDAIACVSECSRRDLEGFLASLSLPVPELFRIRLGSEWPEEAPEGSEHRPPPGSSPLARLGGRPYVLCVSTIERRKNHEVLYRAFRRLAERYDAREMPRLVLVGARGWGVGDLSNDLALDPATRGLILLFHDLEDQDLRVLYRNALFFAFPSLYEGWGLPVAEALGFGKPVVCSDRGALPEVGGQLVDYLDPWDLPGWVSAIERLWRDEPYRQAWGERIAREYVPYPWSATAQAIGRVAVRLEDQAAVGAAAGAGADRSGA